MTSLPKPAKVSANATVPSWTAWTGVPSAAAISMPLRLTPAAGAAEALPDGAGHRPVEVAAEGPSGKAPAAASCAAGAGRQLAQRGLQRCCGRVQLAGELRVQIAALVDVADQRVASCDRLRRLRPARVRPPRGATRARVRRSSSVVRDALSSSSAALMRGDPLAIAPGDRGHHARRLAELPHVGRRQQQPEIAALSQLVELDEPRLQLGRARACSCCLEPRDFRVERPSSAATRVGVGFGLPQLLVLDLPLELEPAQVAEQRPLFRAPAGRLPAWSA